MEQVLVCLEVVVFVDQMVAEVQENVYFLKTTTVKERSTDRRKCCAGKKEKKVFKWEVV